MSDQVITPLARALSIPDYELLRPIGRGAYGEVWLARNVTGSWVALKIVHRSAFDHDRPFEREFEGIKRFEPISRSDPSQVAILHVGLGEGFFYYVMELADDVSAEVTRLNSKSEIRNQKSETDQSLSINLKVGRITPCAPQLATDPTNGAHGVTRPTNPATYQPKTLKRLLNDRGALPADECLTIALSLTRALAHLHGYGLVHRDVKPSNVIFVNGQAKLADIGLVTSVDATRSFVGTEGYLPPEGAGTPQADLYSLGKVLYEMSTGCDRKEFPALPPDIATRSDRDALAELNAIIVRACQLDPQERYSNAEEMHAELALLQKGKSVRQKRTNEQRWAAVNKASLALSVVALLVASAVTLRQRFTRSEYAGEGPPSTNRLATALCDKAMRIIDADTYAAFPEAYANITNAIAQDPYFARPYIGLFDLRASHPILGLPPNTLVDLRTIVRKLEELAPNLAATHRAQSWMSFHDLDFPQAEKRIRQAIKADPKIDPSWYGFMLTHWGRPEEARNQLEIARSNKPAMAIIYRRMGHTYYLERNYTNAIAWYRQALAWDRHHGPAALWVGRAYRAMHDYTNALDYFEQATVLLGDNESETKQRYAELRHAFEERGERGYLEEEWTQTAKNMTNDFYLKAVIQIHLGDTNAAFAWLNKSFDTRERQGAENPLVYLLFNECWDGLHDDPRFKKLLDKIGFTKVMPKRKK